MKVEILVVPGLVLPDLAGIFESRGPPVHNWHGGRAVVNGLDGAQLAVTSSRFSVDCDSLPGPKNWSWRRDLNPRPADYKSAALPD